MFGIPKGISVIIRRHMAEAEHRIAQDVEALFQGSLSDLANGMAETPQAPAPKAKTKPLQQKAAFTAVMTMLQSKDSFSYGDLKSLKAFKNHSYYQVYNFIRTLRSQGTVRKEGKGRNASYKLVTKAKLYSVSAN